MACKTIKILFFLLCAVFGSCKQENWIDWKTQNTLWLQKNKHAANVETTPTGLQYKVIFEGDMNDAKPSSISTVYVDYTLSLINGYVIEHDTVSLTLSNTIKGFYEGLKLMHRKAEFIFYIPADLAYDDEANGTEGYGTFIPPYSTLIYEVRLIDF